MSKNKKPSKKIKDEELAKEYREMWLERLTYANSSQNKAQSDFRNFLTYIPAILLSLTASFAFQITAEFSYNMKLVFVIGLISLLISLFLGLLNASARVNFWDRIANKMNKCFKKYDNARRKKIKLSEAREYQKGLLNGKSSASSKSWPWVLQLILLLIGSVLILISIIIAIL